MIIKYIGIFIVGWLFLTTTHANVLQQHSHFSTWEGLEGDKWASVWLIFKQNPDAELTLYPIGSSHLHGFAFDVPLSAYKRNHRQSTFEVLLGTINSTDPALKTLATIVRDLEINAWKAPQHPFSNIIDTGLRRLDERNHLQSSPINCYRQFFDIVFNTIHQQLSSNHLQQALTQFVETPICLQKDKDNEREK